MIPYFGSNIKRSQYSLAVGDSLVILISIFISYGIRFYINHGDIMIERILSRLDLWLLIVIGVHLFSLHLMDQYNTNRTDSLGDTALFITISVGLSGIIISGIFFFFPKYLFGRQVLLFHLVIASSLLTLWRQTSKKIIFQNVKPKNLAVIGGESIVLPFINAMNSIANSGFRVSDICIIGRREKTENIELVNIKRHGSIEELLRSGEFDIIVIDITDSRYTRQEIRHILQNKYKGKAIYDLPRFFMNLTGKVQISFIDGRWLLNNERFQGKENAPYLKVKRVTDICMAGLLFLVTMPLFLIIAIVIKLDSRGSLFYSQERLCLNRKSFRCYKFRTMVKNAEGTNGPMWSKNNDNRVTRVGKILRRTRLDELPQLWNIIKGDMSIVGPRPIRAFFAKKLENVMPFYNLRFSVKPGLSGWAQINHDYGGSEAGQVEKFQYELFYIQNMSFFLDLLIIFKTIKKVFRAEGT